MGRLGHELRSARQERRQMEDRGDFELTCESIQETIVEDVADPGRGAAGRQLRIEGSEVQRQNLDRT